MLYRETYRTYLVSVYLVVALVLSGFLGGCNMISRLSRVGEEPKVSQIQNPVAKHDYKPVTMPMPAPEPPVQNANSLWRAGAKAFFEDTRASDIGDLVTVLIEINDNATINNNTTRNRTSGEELEINNLLGYDAALNQVLPGAPLPNAVGVTGDSSTNGTGGITRQETVNLRVAATVTQILPNGNMVVEGNQEVKVNYEMRHLGVRGVIRREDITTGNTIRFEQIAEGRVAYGGEGQISDLQQPRYGSQIMDIILPF